MVADALERRVQHHSMIHRLIETLRALATDDRRDKSDQLALDFDDAVLLARDCPQLRLTHLQRDALADVKSAIDTARTSAEWDHVSQRARMALSALDAPADGG